MQNLPLIEKLQKTRHLDEKEYERLILTRTPEEEKVLASYALSARRAVYGPSVFFRGLIEISSFCKNDCRYCGIRRSNKNAERVRLSDGEILSCCAEGYRLGFRTFVMQGGEDPFFTDERLVPLIREIKKRWPDCAVTLSLGERERESYIRLKEAGADRYLLRHETADLAHYRLLHPAEMSFENRMRCLDTLKELGYQTGCGFMVGSPGQTAAHLSKDLAFIEKFQPAMCGIGPFIPHRDTEYAADPAGSVSLTLFLLSVIRLIHPAILLPATTALGTLDPEGREKGILCGANVIMPNLSPASVRRSYSLYDGKTCNGDEAALSLKRLAEAIQNNGDTLTSGRGDTKMPAAAG